MKDLKPADSFFVDVLSIAAIKGPDLSISKEGKYVYEHEQDKEEMFEKVLTPLTYQSHLVNNTSADTTTDQAYHPNGAAEISQTPRSRSTGLWRLP